MVALILAHQRSSLIEDSAHTTNNDVYVLHHTLMFSTDNDIYHLLTDGLGCSLQYLDF